MLIEGHVNWIGSHKYIYNAYFLFYKDNDFKKNQVSYWHENQLGYVFQ